MEYKSNNWYYSLDFGQVCLIVESCNLWDKELYRVWIPGYDSVHHVSKSNLIPVSEAKPSNSKCISYVSTAARISDALTQDVLFAPIESTVIPLPHQIKALSKAISSDRIRYLLADEVGLGKTIEAGLIMRELKLRGMAKRILVIAPKGLVTQWIAEMKLHFKEDFKLLIPSDFSAITRITDQDNIWQEFDQVVTPMDSVKPVESRQGWSSEKVEQYNRERFDDLVSAGWDLVIVDEAHRLGGSTDQIARYKLGKGISESAPYLLLLSATPHQGKTDAFHRVVSLLDKDEFVTLESIHRDRVKPYIIRTEKRHAIDAKGDPLFKPRHTELLTVEWNDKHRQQKHLYDAVTEYAREGYNQALMEKKSYIGFLMILMQRLVTSSTQAIRTTLERRLDVLELPEDQLSLFPTYSDEEWYELDGQDQIDAILTKKLKSLENERDEVKLLLEASKRCESSGPDAKTEALMEQIFRLQQEEGDPDLKILIFTEFVPTQEMLRSYLSDRGFKVTCLNGSMDMEERIRAQQEFSKDARFMISTNAGGEGLNLQFCHVVINYDIPWNPMKLEQRIGRVDRIGQKHVVKAVNFVLKDTVEYRVREVLEEKLAVILQEFGVDKTGDVLDSAQAGKIFDDLYIDAMIDPEDLDNKVEEVIEQIREQAEATKETKSVLGDGEDLDPNQAQKLLEHPLPYWVERMTTNYIVSHNGIAERKGNHWKLVWPDGEVTDKAVFSKMEAEADPTTEHLTLENSKVRGLLKKVSRFVSGQPIPVIRIDGIPGDLKGYWSIWRISIESPEKVRERIMPLFLDDERRSLGPTAQRVWDILLTQDVEIAGYVDSDQAKSAFLFNREHAEKLGLTLYEDLLKEHQDAINRQKEKEEYSFKAREEAINRIGLPAVRDHRLKQLKAEREIWDRNLQQNEQVIPELVPLIILRVSHGDHGNA